MLKMYVTLIVDYTPALFVLFIRGTEMSILKYNFVFLLNT